MDFVPECREPLRHGANVDRPPLRSGDGLVDGAIKDFHRESFTSNAKKGPDVIRPNRRRSSFMAKESIRKAAYVAPLVAMWCFAAVRASRIARASMSPAGVVPSSRFAAR